MIIVKNFIFNSYKRYWEKMIQKKHNINFVNVDLWSWQIATTASCDRGDDRSGRKITLSVIVYEAIK
jgi:hypothetical protein